MIYLQLSAAQGPTECGIAVAHALRFLLREASALAIDVTVIETVEGDNYSGKEDTLDSVLLQLTGAQASRYAARWQGSLQWICVSPLRPSHRRKNWFFGGEVIQMPTAIEEGELLFEAMRSSGPGGQHVNKTCSAIRATHRQSGISVKVQSERSQHTNKKFAAQLIALRLQRLNASQMQAAQSQRRLLHHQVERGNPVRKFYGPDFVEVA